MTTAPTAQLKWTAHPVADELVPALSESELDAWLAQPGGDAAVLEYWDARERMIRESDEDPLRYGFELPFWKDVRTILENRDELYALGGNGPGKTEIGGKIVAETLCYNSNKRVLCVATNENSSKQLQQPAVYKYLPRALKSRNELTSPQRRERVAKVKYTPAGGFTEATFVLPNRSQCWFKTVRQYLDDPNSFEGPEYDLVWLDEPAPLKLLATLRYRVHKRAGKIFVTFTAIHGFDAVCNEVLTGAKLVKSLPMNWRWRTKNLTAENAENAKAVDGFADPELKIPVLDPGEVQVKGCPKGHMPYRMQPLNARQSVIFLWTHWNVFLPKSKQQKGAPAVFDAARNDNKGKVRTRLFGWADKLSGTAFPLFSPAVHVIKPGKIPTEGTDYRGGDPATARSMFILWARVDEQGRAFVFDESPRYEEGEWVGSDGEIGDGQRIYAGLGTVWYKQHIRQREIEHGQEAIAAYGDPRGFATQAASAEGNTSLFNLFQQQNTGEHGAPMDWRPAMVRQTINLDLENVNDLLAYDPDKPVTIENEPRLYISERCQNLIRCMLNWSLDQARTSPWKDPVDTLRYLFGQPLYYVDPEIPEVVGGRGW
jgi:hypothetical protein